MTVARMVMGSAIEVLPFRLAFAFTCGTHYDMSISILEIPTHEL